MGPVYWNETSQQGYTYTESGLEQVVSQNFRSDAQLTGILAISVAAIISLSAVLILLTSMGAAAWLHRGKEASPASKWIKSPIGVYFLSLLVANVLSSLGYTMSLKWARDGTVREGGFCTAQSAIKQIGNVSSALWAIVIGCHVFITIFFERKWPRFLAPIVAVVVWVLVFFLVIVVSLLAIANDRKGPWWGVQPYWCGISDNYAVERFLMEYLPMGIATVSALILYVLTWLRIRGNIQLGDRWLPTFTIRHRKSLPETSAVANHMLWYPLVYAALMAPLCGVRIAQLAGANPSWQALHGATVVFLLSGLANVILYTSTKQFFIIPYLLRFLSGHSTRRPGSTPPSSPAHVLPRYHSESSTATFVTTAPTLVSPAHAHARNSSAESPAVISAPSCVPYITVDLIASRPAPRPPPKSAARARASTVSGAYPGANARPREPVPALVLERRLSTGMSGLSQPWAATAGTTTLSTTGGGRSPLTPWDPKSSFAQPMPRPLPALPPSGLSREVKVEMGGGRLGSNPGAPRTVDLTKY